MIASGLCRNCADPLDQVFADLGMSPLANSYLSAEDLMKVERFYPLRAMVCGRCFMVQLEEFESPHEIFSDYAYFSSWSSSWLEHCALYTEMIVSRLQLSGESHVVELASNDGYLLKYFLERGIPAIGVEPAANVAEAAMAAGVPTRIDFFGTTTAAQMREETTADLIIGNNVLAHVPDLHDFVEGMRILLADDGVITMEFPHVLRLIEGMEFDTIYHEHFSYFSLAVVEDVFSKHDLSVIDVEELPTHGGSLRIYCAHAGGPRDSRSERVTALRAKEVGAGLDEIDTYRGFSLRVSEEKRKILAALLAIKERGCRIVGYGAPAKGNTLLNYCGIRTDFIDFTVDANPAKQGRFLPGTHIPILAPDAIRSARPDYVFILPWNIREEIARDLAYVQEWGGKFLARAPELREWS